MWDERYSQTEYFYGKNPNEFLTIAEALIPRGTNVLAIADGEGRNGVYLAKQGLNITAVDFSTVGREKALALAASQNVKLDYLIADLNEFIFPRKFDAVVSIWVHMPETLRKKVHKQIEENLVKGGLFILESYTPKQLEFNTGGPSSVDMLYTEEQIKSDFDSIEWILAQETLKNITEGAGHLGKSSTLQMIGRKR
jgi:cyclopropane fatty-acyl-phospholipid synthase-like methyltransferase